MRVVVASRGVAAADLLRSALPGLDGIQTATVGRLGEMLVSQHPSLLVVDESSLGSVAALTTCRDVRRDHQSLPLLYLSGKASPADEVVALDSGADSFLTIPCPPELLHARVRALLRRQGPRPIDVLRYGDLEVDDARRQVCRGGREIHLTATEYALLCLFLRSPELVLLRDDLIGKVWGYDYSGNDGVLDVYVCYLRSKLEAQGEPRLIQTVRGAGYVLRGAAVPARERSVASALPRRRRVRSMA